MTSAVREAIDAADQRSADPNAPKVDRRSYLGPAALAEQRILDKVNEVKVVGKSVKVRAERAANVATTKRLAKFTERLEKKHTKDRLALVRRVKNDVKRSVENSLGKEIAELREAYTELIAMLKQAGVIGKVEQS